MPIVFSKPGASAFAEYVPWVNDFIYLTETGQLTEDVKTLGFKAHIPTNDPLLGLTPLEYLKHVRASNAELIARTKATDTNFVRKALKLDVMSEPFPTMTSTQAPTVSFTSPENTTTTRPPLATRKSSTLHKNFVAKLRPLPFQYVWAVWHENPSRSSPPAESTAQNSTTIPTTSYSTRLTLLADSVPDIGAFYRIYNNFPWTSLKLKDTIHIFRAGVKPLWEDKENLDGGAWTLKVRREDGKAVKVWEEICLMGCGGELQAEIAGERDHVLGMSFSPRLYWAHITVWNKKGGNPRSIDVLERTILERLSPDLRPTSQGEYYYKKHSEHEGWAEAVGVKENGNGK